jgi:hypothetical protein
VVYLQGTPVRLLLVPLFVLGLSSLALAQTHDDFVPHDCIAAKDCQECVTILVVTQIVASEASGRRLTGSPWFGY